MTVSIPHTRTRTEAATNVSPYNRALLADLGLLRGGPPVRQYIADPHLTALDEQGNITHVCLISGARESWWRVQGGRSGHLLRPEVPPHACPDYSEEEREFLAEHGWGQMVRGAFRPSESTAVRMAAHRRKTEEDAAAVKRRHRAAMVGGLQLHVSRANDVLQAIDEIGPFSPSSPVSKRLQRAKAEIEQNVKFWEQSIRDLEEKAARSLEMTYEFVLDLKGLHP